MNSMIKMAFLCGVIGLAVAIILSLMAFPLNVSTGVMLTLWPTSIVGMAFTESPKLSLSSLVLISIEYGGNFVLYGLIGLLLAGIGSQIRSKS